MNHANPAVDFSNTVTQRMQRENGRYSAKANMERDHNHVLSGIIVFCFAFAILAVGMNRNIDVYDEGLIVTGASRVATGAIPHRDFYTDYGPAQFYILALVFKLFGSSLLVERIWDLVIKAGIAWLVGSIALRMMRPALAAAVVAVCILRLAGFGFFGYPVWPALLLSFLSVEILHPVFEGRHSTFSIIAAGFSVGMIVLFRYDIGFFACTAESSVLLAFGVFSNARGTRLSRTANLLIPFWFGIALIFAPLMAAYAVTGTLPDFIFQVIEFPSKYYAGTRSLPFPGLSLHRGIAIFIVYLPPIAVLAAIGTILTRDGHGLQVGTIKTDAWNWNLALLGTLTATFFLKGIVRVSLIHMALSIIPGIITLGATIENALAEYSVGCRRMLITALAAIVAAISSLAETKSMARQIMNNVDAVIKGQAEDEISNGSCWPSIDLERAACLIVAPQMAQAIRFVRSQTIPNEPIFVGLGRHDKVIENNVAFYFIADRPPATKWYQFFPGLQTSRSIQDQMIVDLKKAAPRYVIIDTEWDNVNEPNESAVSSGVTALDEFIACTYHVVARYPPYFILELSFLSATPTMSARSCRLQ